MNKKFLTGILSVAVLIVVILAVRKQLYTPVVTPLVDSTAVQKEVCYLKSTKNSIGTMDNWFFSVDYETSDQVHGIINYIPGEQESLVGTYIGAVEKNEKMPGYPNRLNVLYAAYGEGKMSLQQEIILLGEKDIKMASGEKYLDTDGAYKFKDISKLTFKDIIPQTDCASVSDPIKKNYVKIK